MSDRFVVRLSTNAAAIGWIRHVASWLDPILFRVTNGRLTSFGPPAMPMLTPTTKWRRSGRPRAVQLACLEHEGDLLVVASATGQPRDPAWRYNVEANPQVEVQMRGERFRARAALLSDAEKQAQWTKNRRMIPQMKVYETRTNRNIRVIRLRRIASEERA